MADTTTSQGQRAQSFVPPFVSPPIAPHQSAIDEAATLMRNMLRETEVLGCYPMAAEGLKRWLARNASAAPAPDRRAFVDDLVGAGRLSGEQADIFRAALGSLGGHVPAAQPQRPNVGAAVDALGAQWFSLKEIEAVARCIPLVQEHGTGGALVKAEQIDALSRAVCELVGTSIGLHETIEAALVEV
jgi:hypothetical protein